MTRGEALLQKIGRAPIIPVLVVNARESAEPLALALSAGGVTAVEVTLRTDCALEVLRDMKAACPDLIVGAGTVLHERDVEACLKSGADFLVTPGVSAMLARSLVGVDVPAYPGASTASEALQLLDLGFDRQKFFPAEVAGGVPFLKAIGAPLPAISFMPTGGITPERARDYLALLNVFAIGGSWLATADRIAAGDWAGIERACRVSFAALDAGTG